MSPNLSPQAVILKIVFWIEMILAARILLFTVPVLLNGLRDRQLDPSGLQNWMILSLTVIALLYLIVGVASVLSFQGWKIFQYLAALLTIVVMTAVIRKALQSTTDIGWTYSLPVVFAVFTTGCVALLKPRSS